ncbi:unnamed protein product, partial [Rotaria sp. Silwood1]
MYELKIKLRYPFVTATLQRMMSYTAIDGTRAHRRRQNLDLGFNTIYQNSPTYNAQDRFSPQKNDRNEIVLGKKDSRQYNLYRSRYGYGTIQGINYPYGSSGVGPYRYGYGEYGQYGQRSDRYALYYIQNQGLYGHYSGYNSAGYYNRPDYYPSLGGNYYGGYFWNDGEQYHMN